MKIARTALYAVAAILLVAVCAVVYNRLAPRTTPKGQPTLVHLKEARGLAELREPFNASIRETRVLAMLSPT